MLSGLRVLDLSDEPLAYTGRVLADLGADVVLIEPPGGGPARRLPPLVEVAGGMLVSAHFAFNAAGKRSVTLDLSADSGRHLFEQLVTRADVALLPEDPAVLDRFGLDGDALQACNERLIVARATAFGSSGPRRRWRASDLVAWASSGAAFGLGDPDRPSVAPGGGLALAAGALNAAAGAMLALRSRRRGGRGQQVDVSLQEATLSVAMEAGPLLTLEGRAQEHTGGRRGAAHGLYPVQDGSVELVAFLPSQWDAMAAWISEELGYEEATLETFRGSIMSRVPYFELIDGWVLELAARYTKQGFFEEAQRRGIPCGPVNNAADLLEDPHLGAVGAWVEVRHPDIGALRSPRGPVRFDGQPVEVGPVPAPGEHTEAVLGRQLGLTPPELADLRARGVV